MRDDWPEHLLASIAKQAVRDWRSGYRHQGIMDAGKWLAEASLLDTDGTLIYERNTNVTENLRCPASDRGVWQSAGETSESAAT